MPTEGELTVRLAWDGHRIRDVAIVSSRPFVVGRLLAGRTPDEALALVPRLYSLCAEAQGGAARTALEAAGACDPDAGRSALAERRVLLEIVQEHVWRLLLDWPQAMGRDGLPQVVATARRAIGAELARLDAAMRGADAGEIPIEPGARLGAELAALLERNVFGTDVGTWWSSSDPAALARWTAESGTLPAILLGELQTQFPALGRSDTTLMPDTDARTLRDTIVPSLRNDAGFARAPEWAGRPVETGPLARWQRHPLIAALRERDGHTAATRVVARLVDLAARVLELRGEDPEADARGVLRPAVIGPAEGLGVAETARGLLLHRVRTEGGRIAAWDIVAPTEWNFHPHGALTKGLLGIAAPNAAAIDRAARIAVQALDPCVACHVEVVDA